MKIILLFSLVALAIAGIIHPPPENKKIVEKDDLIKMKKVIHLMMHIYQPSTFKDELQKAKGWKFQDNLSHFSDSEYIQEYIALLDYGLLPRGEIFSRFNEKHLAEAIALFRVFYSANNFDTFYEVACWARNNVNEDLFLYSFTIALKHRQDCQNVVIPPPYEIVPNYFINEETIQQAYRLKARNVGNNTEVILPYNFTQWYKIDNDEQKISYFYEDIDVGLYNYYFHLDYPEWLEENSRGFKNHDSSELFLFSYKQLLARVYMERLNQGLGQIEHIDIKHPTKTAYAPFLRHRNGHSFVRRPEGMNVLLNKRTSEIAEKIVTYELRMSEAIDSRLVITNETRKVDLTTEKGVQMLGHIIYGQVGHVLRSYYGHLLNLYHQLFSYSDREIHGEYITTSALYHDASAVRDPMFYRIYKRLFNYVNKFVESFPRYNREQFDFPGVEVNKVEADKLVTFDEDFYVDITNAIDTDIKFEANQEKSRFKVKMSRLNHKSFNYKIHVNSNKKTQAVVRAFIGPKYDEYGQLLYINDNYLNFIEIDKFIVDLDEGQNVISRNSRNSHRTRTDQTSIMTLYQNVLKALEGKQEFAYDYSEMHCRVPDRLLLPKSEHGSVNHFFIMLTSAENIKTEPTYTKLDWCRLDIGQPFFDDKPPGYPFDRPIQYKSFYTPNMRFVDVELIHKPDINRIVP